MKKARFLSVLLAAVTMLSCVPFRAQAVTLSAAQQTFFENITAIASEEMKTSHVLASVTIAQAIWESSWGQSDLTKKTNNYFGFTVGSSWTGMIYCSKNNCFYSNRTEAMNILGTAQYNYWASGGDNGRPGFWRVYGSLAESVKDHNEQLATSSYYKGIPYETDYKVVCGILNKYYCADGSYGDALISTIESYELYKYDGASNDPTQVTSLVLGTRSVVLALGESVALSVSVYPSTAADKTVTFTSSDTSVASVSAAGVIKAVGTGTAVVTAKTSNGIKSEVSVYCSKTGEVTYKGTINKNVYCRAAKSDSTAGNLGVFAAGAEVIIYGDADGTWYFCSGENQSGDVVNGYVYVSCVSGVTPYVAEQIQAKYSGQIVTEVYCRAAANASKDNNSGIFAVGTKVIVYGDEENGFYRVSGINKDGADVTGYIYTDCVKLTGEYSSGETQFAGDDGVNYRFATTVSALNCRKGPDVSYDIVGVLAGGATVVVCGEGVSGDGLDGTWYYIKGLDKDGKSVAGYCGGDYLRIDSDVLASAGAAIDGESIMGVTPKTTLSAFSALVPKLTVSLTASDGGTYKGSYIGTGCNVKVSFAGQELFAKRAIVTGDIDGDGKIQPNDYIILRKHILGITVLTGDSLLAADLDGNGKLAPNDYIRLRKILLNMQ